MAFRGSTTPDANDQLQQSADSGLDYRKRYELESAGMNDQLSPATRRWPSVFLVLLILAILAVLAGMGWLQAAWRALNAESIAGVAAYVRGFGLWAPLISLLLMLLQSVIAPLPGSIVAAANGVIFGVWLGTLLSWAGGMLGATASFWLARLLGQAAVERWFSRAHLERIEAIGEAHGFWLVLLARLTPLVSFDLISYLAGLSAISFGRFMLATAIGMLPGTFAWTALGHDLAQAQTTTWRLSLLAVFAVVAALAGRWWRRYAGRPEATK
jgi:uncharacterized membrane protein YdjX (TVP38/TMEM64 family)